MNWTSGQNPRCGHKNFAQRGTYLSTHGIQVFWNMTRSVDGDEEEGVKGVVDGDLASVAGN